MTISELDHSLTFWLYQGDGIGAGIEKLFYSAASLFVYLLPLILIFMFFRSYRDRVQSIKIALAVAFVWRVLSQVLAGWLYGQYGFRERPFAEYGIQELFFERPAKAFPSDHAAVLMIATLLFLYYKYPKLGWLFLVGGVISSFSRVVIGFHWVGDVLGGWVLAVIAYLIIRAIDGPLTKLVERILTTLRLKGRADQLRV